MSHHDVFVSYSSQDKPIADAACATLEARGIRCWIAPRDVTPGQDWSEAIIDAISACRVFVLILSAASNQSEQVKREVQNAVSEAKSILPFRVEDVALSKHMRYFIGTPHWLDALTPPMERHLQRMAETVAAWIASLDSKAGEALTIPIALHATPHWDADRLSRIEAELRLFVGPFGHTLVQEAAAAAHDYHDLCRRLSEHILSERERQAFLARCAPLIPAAEAPEAISRPSAVSTEIVAAGEKALAHYIGPLARVLARRAARAAADPVEFHRLLAEHLPTPAEKAEFLRRVQH
ncbi:MAG: toll/interleukin-1 receptor domain-containing protein [Armatimonadetes bacterium]|nr:toll/interleukin-1 receptor domain-containing protein [Armatimonadota bacterium]